MLKIREISVNGVKEPHYLPCEGLRLSWVLESDEFHLRQVSYRIRLQAGETILWDSGLVESDRSVQLPLPVTLPPRTDCRMVLTVTTSDRETAEREHCFATALRPQDWSGIWIRPRHRIEGWSPYLRTKFRLRAARVSRARLYVSGLGCGEYT